MMPVASSGSGGMSGGAGNPGTAGGAAGAMDPGRIDPSDFDYANQTVMLTETLTIAAGDTLHVGPGTIFTASMGVQMVINGTLIVDGTAEAPVAFDGMSTPRSWEGIVIGQRRRAQDDARQDRRRDLRDPGADRLGVRGLVFGDRDQLQGRGVVRRRHVRPHEVPRIGRRHLLSGQRSLAGRRERFDDDHRASPTVTHSSFDHSSSLVDMIRVGGSGSPVLDHVSITSAHCGLHTNGAANTMPTIKNSVLQGMSYGIMAYTSKPTFENCNFIDNAQDIGFCFDATADNSPTLTGNYYSSGSASYDASCFEIGKPDSAPAAAPIDGVGPIGL